MIVRETIKKIQTALNGDLVIKLVTGISLAGIIAVFAAIYCMVVHAGAYAGTNMANANIQIAADNTASKNNTVTQGEASFDAGKIHVIVHMGIRNGKAYENRYAPYHVQLKNEGGNFEGYFRVFFTGYYDGKPSMFQKKVSIAAGESKKLDSVVCIPQKGNYATVALCDKKGGILGEKMITLQTTASSASEKEVGILSEDASGLGYLSGGSFNVTELSKADIMEDARGLDIYDALLINNMDTQSLSDKQISAITQWVENGGNLILGTGAQAEKTLKAFSGNLLKGTIGDTRTIQTQFGDYGSQREILEQRLEIDLHNDKIADVKDFLFNNLSNDLRNMYYDSINTLDYWDSWKTTLLSPGSDIYKELSEKYSDDELETLFDVRISDEEKQALVNGLNVGEISKDITTLAIENSKSLMTQDNEQLISKLDYGNGCVIVTEFDLALDNQYWDSYGAIIKNLFFQNCNAQYYTSLSSSYDEDYDTSLSDALNINEVSGLPNMSLYLFLLLAYVLLVGPIAYVILRRKDKRNLLWTIVPVSAVLCSVVIYLIGTSTRIQKPYLNYLSQLFITGDNTARLETAFSLVSPNNNNYQVELDGAVDVRPYPDSSDWYYDSGADMINDSYRYGIEYAADSTTLHMDNLSAFEPVAFWNGQKAQQSGKMEFSGLNLSESNPSGIVTNHLNYNLEDCVIVYSGNMIYIGSIAKGESVSLDQAGQDNIFPYNDDWDYNVRRILYGDSYEYYGVKDTNKARRVALLQYYGNSYLSENTANVYFYGFCAAEEGTPFTDLFSLNQYGETAVIQEITSADIMVEGETKVGVLSDFAQSQTGAKVDDSGLLDINPEEGDFGVDVTVVYDLADIQKKYKSLTARYLAGNNKEFNVYSVHNYASNIFVGSISVRNPKTGKFEHWAEAGHEANLDKLEQYIDDQGKVKMLYSLRSDNTITGFYDGLQLPVIQVMGK